MTNFKSLILTLSVAAILTACVVEREPGPAERVGRGIDEIAKGLSDMGENSDYGIDGSTNRTSDGAASRAEVRRPDPESRKTPAPEDYKDPSDYWRDRPLDSANDADTDRY
ncbi:MAG: hypothetical protein KDD42_05585 [Bdellovibrionales bacterium]|nr:hypothetical protein [Bdellovibrionales bacterium]